MAKTNGRAAKGYSSRCRVGCLLYVNSQQTSQGKDLPSLQSWLYYYRRKHDHRAGGNIHQCRDLLSINFPTHIREFREWTLKRDLATLFNFH